MMSTMQFESYTIEQVETRIDINYLVSNDEGYICWLVPREDGLDIAEEDKSCGLPPDEVSRISDFILNYNR